jgi:Asp/Glu/hydantoin racemase
VVSRCIPDQPEGIHDGETERIAVPKVLALAKEMEREGMERS